MHEIYGLHLLNVLYLFVYHLHKQIAATLSIISHLNGGCPEGNHAECGLVAIVFATTLCHRWEGSSSAHIHPVAIQCTNIHQHHEYDIIPSLIRYWSEILTLLFSLYKPSPLSLHSITSYEGED